jgi:acetyl-CoA acetyltransferase family protein
MPDVFIIEAVRTPVGVGKPEKGALYPVAPVNLAAWVIRTVAEKAGVELEMIDDVILGCVTPIDDQGGNIARLALLQAGFPFTVPGVSLNRMCGSGQQSVHFGAQAIIAGDMDLVIAGGIEMMSHQPLGADYPQSWPEDMPYKLVHQGISAEMMAERWQLDREALDDYAYQSHIKAAEAIRQGRFKSQILPIQVPQPDGSVRVVDQDEGVRMEPDREKMRQLKPVFKKDGVVTAGNSSQISDGAAALLLASEEAVKRLGLTPMVRLVSRVVVGSDPALMLDGPIPATTIALDRAGLEVDQIDRFEVNEAFASAIMAWIEDLDPPLAHVNPDGGAIALGHPLGATGAVLMTKLVHGLTQAKEHYGLQAMCIGHGMATASILERV